MTEQIERSASASLCISWGSVSDKGKVRDENEDSYYVNEDLSLFIVSDGMGGHQGGRLASKIIVEDLPVMIETRWHKARSTRSRAIGSLLRNSIIEQNQHMYMEGLSESGYVDMGATVVVVFIHNSRVYVANVGDSQAFRFRNHRLWQITKDHTVISELLEQNEIEHTEIDGHPAQGQITQYIGMNEDVCPHLRSFHLRKNDLILLCSDGLTDMISLREISNILTTEQDAQIMCQGLVDAAKQAGGHDNITALCIHC